MVACPVDLRRGSKAHTARHHYKANRKNDVGRKNAGVNLCPLLVGQRFHPESLHRLTFKLSSRGSHQNRLALANRTRLTRSAAAPC